MAGTLETNCCGESWPYRLRAVGLRGAVHPEHEPGVAVDEVAVRADRVAEVLVAVGDRVQGAAHDRAGHDQHAAGAGDVLQGPAVAAGHVRRHLGPRAGAVVRVDEHVAGAVVVEQDRPVRQHGVVRAAAGAERRADVRRRPALRVGADLEVRRRVRGLVHDLVGHEVVAVRQQRDHRHAGAQRLRAQGHVVDRRAPGDPVGGGLVRDLLAVGRVPAVRVKADKRVVRDDQVRLPDRRRRVAAAGRDPAHPGPARAAVGALVQLEQRLGVVHRRGDPGAQDRAGGHRADRLRQLVQERAAAVAGAVVRVRDRADLRPGLAVVRGLVDREDRQAGGLFEGDQQGAVERGVRLVLEAGRLRVQAPVLLRHVAGRVDARVEHVGSEGARRRRPGEFAEQRRGGGGRQGQTEESSSSQFHSRLFLEEWWNALISADGLQYSAGHRRVSRPDRESLSLRIRGLISSPGTPRPRERTARRHRPRCTPAPRRPR
jgi:hypothetical protein